MHEPATDTFSGPDSTVNLIVFIGKKPQKAVGETG